MKKLISLALVLTMLVLPLSGCHGTTGRSAFVMPAEFDTSRTYEITFMAKNDNNKTQREIYAQIVSDFEALYPNIKVTLINQTDYGDIHDYVKNNIATDTTPNVCITYPDYIAVYLTAENSVVALDELMADEKYGLGGSALRFDGVTAEQIIPEFLEEGKLDGRQYALPFMRSTEACYVNKTLLESLGYELPEVLTWDFVWEVCEYAMSLGKTTVEDENGKKTEVYAANGQTTFLPFIYKSTDNMMISMLKQLGAGYSTDRGQVEIFNDTTTDILYTVAEHTKSGAFGTFKIDSYPSNFLNAGQCIFAVDSTAGATWAGCDAPNIDIAEEDLVVFETVVMTVPQADTENIQMISQGPSVCVFNKDDAQEVLASWLFAQFLLTDGAQIAYSQTEGYVPVTSKAQQSDVYQDYLARAGENNDLYYCVKLDATKLLLENTQNTFVAPVFVGSSNLREAAGQMIESTVKAVRRKNTVNDDFIRSLQQDMTTLYHLNEISTSGKQTDMGPLPTTAVVLLGAIALAWVGIGIYTWIARKKKLKNQ